MGVAEGDAAQGTGVLIIPGDGIVAGSCTGGSEVAVLDGVLRATAVCYAENKAGVLGLSSRFARLYTPYEGDSIVGVIIERAIDGYLVDIRAALPAFIGATAFLGASRKNPVLLKAGDAIYARISSAPFGAQPQLTCALDGHAALTTVSTHGRVVYGTLAMGVEAGLLFKKLAKLIPFKGFAGPNGLLWVTGSTLYDSITVQRCLEDPLEMDVIVQERANLISRGGIT
ncbi:Exosome complex exonuclease, putative [Giardia lamblia P15]|uniref:Exosome complex exonuclease, putative n=1 Tax=Giardia intestinalis (strain P15) TaxID=658858 RepID=E1F0X4_GIAIA|nr:Exosome complex exonuclease, putative [Giardia lamblia P15]